MPYFKLFSDKEDTEKCIGFIKCNDIIDDFFDKSPTANKDISYGGNIKDFPRDGFYSISSELFWKKIKEK